MKKEREYYFNKDNAAEMQAKSAKARKKNRNAREVLRDALMEKVGDMTRMEYLTKKVLENSESEMTWKDLKIMHELLGEYTSNVNVETKKPEDVVKEIMDAVQ